MSLALGTSGSILSHRIHCIDSSDHEKRSGTPKRRKNEQKLAWQKASKEREQISFDGDDGEKTSIVFVLSHARSAIPHLDTLVAAALAAAHAEPPQEASVPIREPSELPEGGRAFSSAISIDSFFSVVCQALSHSPGWASLSFSCSPANSKGGRERG